MLDLLVTAVPQSPSESIFEVFEILSAICNVEERYLSIIASRLDPQFHFLLRSSSTRMYLLGVRTCQSLLGQIFRERMHSLKFAHPRIYSLLSCSPTWGNRTNQDHRGNESLCRQRYSRKWRTSIVAFKDFSLKVYLATSHQWISLFPPSRISHIWTIQALTPHFHPLKPSQ
jgi:hypothetical protein